MNRTRFFHAALVASPLMLACLSAHADEPASTDTKSALTDEERERGRAEALERAGMVLTLGALPTTFGIIAFAGSTVADSSCSGWFCTSPRDALIVGGVFGLAVGVPLLIGGFVLLGEAPDKPKHASTARLGVSMSPSSASVWGHF